MDPVAGGRRQANLITDGVGDRALRRLFHALERHRPLERHHHQLIFRGSHSRRPGRRYENLLLAAAVGRLQLDCLNGTTSGYDHPEVESVLRAEVEQELRRHEQASERLRDRLLWIVRRRAEARARRRFERIVAQVTADVGGEIPPIMIAGACSPSAESSADELHADAREPKLDPAAEPGRCTALTRRGARCRNPAGAGGLCDLHARIAVGPVPAAGSEVGADQRADGDRAAEGIHADTVWAVGGFVLVAAVLAWTGVPVGEDAPVGSRVVVGEAAVPAVSAVEAQPFGSLNRAPGDGGAADRDAGGGRREPQKATNAGRGESVESSTPTEVTTATDVADVAPAPAPAPDQAAEGAPTDDGAGDPAGGGGPSPRPDPVRGELVDEMLGTK